MSFRYKIAFTIFIVASLIMFLVVWASLSYMERSLKEAMHSANSVMVQTLVEHSAREAFRNEEYGRLQIEMENIAQQTSIATIVMLDINNKVLAANELRMVGQTFDRSTSIGHWHGQSIVSGGTIVGQIAYQFSGEKVQQATAQALRFSLLMSFIGVLLIAGVGLIFGSMLADRLEKIAESTEDLSNGELNVAEADLSDDEVGKLSRFLQSMAKSQREYISELEISRERMRMALEIGGVATWSWDFKAKELTWSAKYYQSLGILPNSAKPSYKLWLSRVHADDLKRVEEAVAQMVRQHKDLDIEFRIMRPNGSVNWMHNIARVHFDHDGEPLEIYGLQIDITRFKERVAAT